MKSPSTHSAVSLTGVVCERLRDLILICHPYSAHRFQLDRASKMDDYGNFSVFKPGLRPLRPKWLEFFCHFPVCTKMENEKENLRSLAHGALPIPAASSPRANRTRATAETVNIYEYDAISCLPSTVFGAKVS